MTVATIACIVLYLSVAWQLGWRVLASQAPPSTPTSSRMLVLVGVVAMTLHAAALYSGTIDADGLRLGLFNAMSLIGWVVAALVLFAVHGRPLDSLGVFVLPLTALTVLLAWAFPATSLSVASADIGIQVHIVVSILAYGLLALAALQAGLVSLQDHLLRSKRHMGALRALPPLTRQESLLFQLIAAGFFFLSLALVSGIMFVQDLFAQHLVHKTALSALAWVIFGVLLLGRWRYGWRGRAVVRWTLAAFVVLMLAYFGAKLVLEEILGRSWSG